MQKSDQRYTNYLQILKEELVPAMGCTEPIAIAYGAAKAREILGCVPDAVLIEASGNIIKNVKSVVVPNTGNLHGIEAAAAAGIVAGKAERVLEVIAEVSEEEKAAISRYLATHKIEVRPAETDMVFDIIITLYAGESVVKLRISEYHTNIVYVEKDGAVLLEAGHTAQGTPALTDRSFMTVRDIVEFVESMDLEDAAPLVEPQIELNFAIANAGLAGDWGANIGSVLLGEDDSDVKTRARAMAAAGSDARMSGCELPVIIVSGSGNQGITASVPVVVYADALQVGRDRLIRAVTLSDLLTIHLKTGIGRLSAYCGAVSAGCAAGAAIAWLRCGEYDAVTHTLVNSLAIVSGMICDGAKPSCAAKIAASVDAGLLGYQMYEAGQQFYGGEGIVTKGVENTIKNVGRLGQVGMRETDKEIIRIMTGM